MDGSCPKCHSNDIRPAYLNYIGRGAALVGSFAVSLAAGLLTGGNNVSGLSTAKTVGEKLEPQGDIKKHHCNSCGHEW